MESTDIIDRHPNDISNILNKGPSNGSQGSSSPADSLTPTEQNRHQKASDKPNTKRRIKTSRACLYCQKAHLTCDSGRPCQRCIKRGIADTCQDGRRKKAKYLMDVPPDALQSQARLDSKSGDQVILPLTPPDANAKTNINTRLMPLPGSIITSNFVPANGALPDSSQPLMPPMGPVQDVIFDPVDPYDFGSKAANLEYSIITNILDQAQSNEQSLFQLQTLSPQYSTDSSMHTFLTNHNSPPHDPLTMTTTDIYQNITTPFPYTHGYHALIAYLKKRFDKRHLMQIAKAMAAYRPTFIATTKTLNEEDLIFMEQCFQRTLMEYKKLISFTGTPTVIWRRTGQIAAVGREFCLLTSWSHEKLLDDTFIVELMDDQSVTDYFDAFSKLAFGDSRGVNMTECTLIRPTKEKILTACTWTVKRDVFDIPMLIVGNFLPILK